MADKEKRLLVVVDGTERSLMTIRYLTQFIPFYSMSITLMHVFSTVPEPYWDLEKEPSSIKFAASMRVWKRQHEIRITEYMDKCRRMLVEGGLRENKINIKVQPIMNGVAKDILAEAQAGYHAVVLRRRGRAFLGDMIIGSVAANLLEKLATVPLIIAGPDPVNHRLLVALDRSTASDRVLDFVGATVAGQSVEVLLLHVVRHQDWLEETSADLPKLEDEVKESIPAFFDSAIDRLERWGVDRTHITSHLVTGVYSRAGAIVEEAVKGQFGTIVVGRRDLSRVQVFYMGRVGHKVIQVARKHTIWVVS